MEGVDANEAANRMVTWFNLDIEKLNADSKRAAKPSPNRKAAESAKSKPKPSPTTPPSQAKPKAETLGKPEANKPLGFALKLETQHPYFMERGLTSETVAEFGLGFCAKGVMSGRIAIPIHNTAGELVGYAGRWPGEPPDERPKYRLPDGFKKASEIYRLGQAMKQPFEQPLIIVEGFFDVMKLWQLGICKAVALMGSSMSAAQEELIAKFVLPYSTAIVMFDEDAAGRAGREEVVRRLAKRMFVRVIVFEKEDFQPEHLTVEQAKALQLLPQ
jgi:DNA primase